VDFLNDAWGGTPETDRNLYIGGVIFESPSLPSQVLPNSGLALYAGGPQSISFRIAPPEPMKLVGTDGPDRLQETLGHGDVFFGGAGADSFAFGIGIAHGTSIPSGDYFASTLGTGVGPGDRDVILDFQPGEDVIDLSAALQFSRRVSQVDAVFRFIGDAPFSGTPDHHVPAEVRYEVSGDATIIQMDANGLSAFYGDGIVDAEIELAGVFSLTSSDFIL
jgi:Ca2+-binding RTX toxin-like protein